MIKEQIVKELQNENITIENIGEVPDKFTGDYSVACFGLAKKMGQNPQDIAQSIVENFKGGQVIEKLESVGPYINITLNKKYCATFVKPQALQFDTFSGKTACIDFSSINLAKHPHIGHLCTTIIGACVARLLEKVGYKVVRINYLGDYGTPFGKLITAIKKWGNRAEIEKIGVDAIQDLYVKFNAEETDELLAEAREWFKKIEEKDAEALEIYEWIINLSLNEMKSIYKLLDIDFDDYNGERYYEGKKDGIINALKAKNLVFESEGALLVDLSKYNLPDFMVRKSDGTSLYSTRDIASAIDRKEKYNFDMSLYVTDTAQNLHFNSLFKTLELMGYDWVSQLKHINYGRLSTPSGKIASRRGKVAVLKDIFETAENKAYTIVKERNLDKNVATDIGVSAISFGLLKTERVKDAIFDLESALNFDGETSVYLQYTVARLNSIAQKASEQNVSANFVENYALNDDELALIKQIDLYCEMIFKAYQDFEPCYIARYAIKLATLFNKFYTNCTVLGGSQDEISYRLLLCATTREVLCDCMKLLGVKIVSKM